jgi:uncharacterized caspase-like protein
LFGLLMLRGECIVRFAVHLVAAICAILAGSQQAEADRRVALVIGNSAYKHTEVLPNPRNDAEAIAKLLDASKFDEVLIETDLDYHGMRGAIHRFEPSARSADVALIYYAGHGFEVAGENYLMPVDAGLAQDSDLANEAITLASMLSAANGARRLKLVILDACRNNPLIERMALRAGRSRSVPVLVAYSAKAGTVAYDGHGRHSPYAEALLKHMATPGLDVIRMFGRVKDAVLTATKDAQEPWIYGSPGGDSIALVPATAKPPASK